MYSVTKEFAREMHICHGGGGYSRNMAARRRGVKRAANRIMRTTLKRLVRAARLGEELQDRLDNYSVPPKGFATGWY